VTTARHPAFVAALRAVLADIFAAFSFGRFGREIPSTYTGV